MKKSTWPLKTRFGIDKPLKIRFGMNKLNRQERGYICFQMKVRFTPSSMSVGFSVSGSIFVFNEIKHVQYLPHKCDNTSKR